MNWCGSCCKYGMWVLAIVSTLCMVLTSTRVLSSASSSLKTNFCGNKHAALMGVHACKTLEHKDSGIH